MEVEVNLWAVLLAALSTLVVGSVWYAKPVFGKTWMKLIGKTDKDLEKVGMAPIFVAFVVSFVTAYVLAHLSWLAFSFYDDVSFFSATMTTAVFAWLGFTAVRFITHDGFEGRPKQLTAINIIHEFVTFAVMAVIIGLMAP